jgi:hypothetical protein
MPKPILDSTGKVFCVCLGRPEDPTYLRDCHKLADLIHDLHGNLSKETLQADNRRGEYVAVNTGVSYGFGQRVRGDH